MAVKIPGLPTYAPDRYPPRSVHGEMMRMVEALSPERTFWGSDVTRLYCAYQQVVELLIEELGSLSSGDLDLVMERALMDWIGWRDSDAQLEVPAYHARRS